MASPTVKFPASFFNLTATRLNGNVASLFEEKYFSITRDEFESISVTYQLSEADSKVGLIRISEFDLTTPKQFKNAVDTLQKRGAEHFIFDVRNNPGGDLQSIRAVLSYILNDGDLILSAIKTAQNKKYISTSILQRTLNIGYATAKSVIEDMCKCGYLKKDTTAPYDRYLYTGNIESDS